LLERSLIKRIPLTEIKMEASSIDFQSLARDDLQVFTPNNDDDEESNAFQQALIAPIFNVKLLEDLMQGDDHHINQWPAAVCQAHSVDAVQKVLRFCRQYSLKVCVRSGGHCWHGSWFKGPNTVLLDVGALNTVQYDETQQTLTVGPGAKGLHVLQFLQQRSPQPLFFPCGHCPNVSLGGFILGGGYGIGHTRYGMTSMLVDGVEAVLGSGEIVRASTLAPVSEPEPDSSSTRITATTRAVNTAMMDLIRGSHACFPAVITKFYFSNLPSLPKGLLTGGDFIYNLTNYRTAVRVALAIQCRSDYLSIASKVETTLIFKQSWPELVSTTGAQQCAIVAITIWADTPEEGQTIWQECQTIASEVGGDPPLLPTKDELQCGLTPADLPPIMGASYPSNHRFEVQAHSAGPDVYGWTDEEIAIMVEPVVDMWMMDNNNEGGDNMNNTCGSQRPPQAPSHTLFCPLHPETQTRTHGGKSTVSGFTPAITIMSYAIYKDKSMDDTYRDYLERAHARMVSSPVFFTEIPEGKLCEDGPESAITQVALDIAKAKAKLLDPGEVFSGF
jgi:hypothetical protein